MESSFDCTIMDEILDIDELTKDDSFFSDAKHNDVCNIIQQWKNNSNNSLLQQQQQQILQSNQQKQQNYQQNIEKGGGAAYKVNSRTFTRPKRKLAVQNLESQFNGISEQYQLNSATTSNTQISGKLRTPNLDDTSPPEFQNVMPVLNVQIGGKIRTPMSARSLLQDTSPPSSMDVSLDYSPMNNSLVTSADFTNISFLLATPSLEASTTTATTDKQFNNCYFQQQQQQQQPATRYTLCDMIRDRKALESLTLSSEDGALIKDLQISQVDDISIGLWKGNSGSSTMDNSTESVEGNGSGGSGCGAHDATIILQNNNNVSNSFGERTIQAINVNNLTFTSGDGSSDSNQTMILSCNSREEEEKICETTFNLSDHLVGGQSFIIERKNCGVPMSAVEEEENEVVLPVPQNIIHEEQPMKPSLNETICLQNDASIKPADATFDESFKPLKELQLTPEENRLKFNKQKFASTPQAARTNYVVADLNSKFTPSMNMINENLDISPIVLCAERLKKPSQKHTDSLGQLNETYDKIPTAAATVGCRSPLSHLNVDEEEMLENIKEPNSNETFKRYHRRSRSRGGRSLNLVEETAHDEQQQQQQQQKEQQDLKDLADLEEQARITKSVIEMQDVMDLVEAEAELLAAPDNDVDDEFDHMLDELSRIELNAEQLKMKKSLETIKKRFNCSGSGSGSENNTTTNSSSIYNEVASSKTFTSETREEALRHLRDEMARNRANDIINSSIQSLKELNNSGSSNGSGGGTSITTSSERLLSRRSRLYDDVNLSQLVTTNNIAPVVQTTTTNESAAATTEEEQMKQKTEKENENEAETETENPNVAAAAATKYKLIEKRERDRERFKTMKIIKDPNNENECASQNEINVPCIDDYDDNDDDIEKMPENSQRISRRDFNNENASSNNFLTYKIPKGKQQPQQPQESQQNVVAPKNNKINTEIRSLSRPRYISGLQKFSVVSKAVSAGDLEKSDNNSTTTTTKTAASSLLSEGKATQLQRPNANFKKNNFNGIKAKPTTAATTATTTNKTNELKSPMGLKAKSLHNLSSNLNFNTFSSGIATPSSGTAANASSRLSTYGLRKINSGGLVTEQQQQQLKADSNVLRSQKPSTQSKFGYVQKQNSNNVFKKPQAPVSSGRPTENRTSAGLARPSSGYYSLNATTITKVENVAQENPINTTVIINDMKSNQNITTHNNVGKAGNNVTATIAAAADANQLTKITIGASGIPKPSGLRPPNKRSGLPVRR